MSAGRHRGPIVLLETGTLISGIGNGVALVVLPWLVLEQTGSATSSVSCRPPPSSPFSRRA